MFDVTEETVRRDLDILEGEGKLRRSHGGAVCIDPEQTETPIVERESEHVVEKEAIAREALKYISAGDRIALDASTTAWHVAVAMPNIPLTVLTNSLKVALELANRDKIEVISTGGILRSTSLSYVGPMAEESLARFHVNKAFVSCKGMHTEYGLSESNALQALVKRKMIEIADVVYVLADHSKIQVQDFTQVAGNGEIDVLITDAGAPRDVVDEFLSMDIKVLQV